MENTNIWWVVVCRKRNNSVVLYVKVRTDQPLPLFHTCPTYYIVVTSFPVSCISISTFWMSVKFIFLNLYVSVSLFFLFLCVSDALSHIRVYGCKFWKSYERKSWRQALVLVMLQRVFVLLDQKNCLVNIFLINIFWHIGKCLLQIWKLVYFHYFVSIHQSWYSIKISRKSI